MILFANVSVCVSKSSPFYNNHNATVTPRDELSSFRIIKYQAEFKFLNFSSFYKCAFWTQIMHKVRILNLVNSLLSLFLAID